MIISFRSFIFGAVFLAGALLISPSAQAATITVCNIGCDYTTLIDAVSADAPGQDTYLLEVGYTSVFPPESTGISLPDDTILTCQPGVVFGDDFGPTSYLYPGNNNSINNCLFQNTRFDATGRTDVSWLNNTFSDNTLTDITLTLTDGFTISGNSNINHLQIQNADNGIISNNTINCRFGSNCLSMTTAGGGPFDYTDPADVPNDIVFNNNVFTNYNTPTGGDFVYLAVGLNIDYTSNTLQSAPLPDSFITMMTVANVEATISGNYFFFPEKPPASFGGTWGLNIRVADGDTNLIVENNHFVGDPSVSTISGNTCLGVFDDTNGIGLQQVNIAFNYNLCYNANPTVNDSGISLSHDLLSSTVNLTAEYNGFFNTDQLIGDNTGTYTTLSSTNITADPVMRTENANPADDYVPVPMSRYFDIDGTRDIGAVSDVRITNYTIIDGCVVDYSSCYSQSATIIDDVIKNGDTVNFGAGTYPGLSISGPLSGVTVQGIGPMTIFDGGINFLSALSLTNVTSSFFNNFSLVNSTDTSITTYDATLSILSFAGNDYDDSDVFGGPAGAIYFIPDLACNAEIIEFDGQNVSIDGMSNVNAGIADVGGSYVTILFHDIIADNLNDAQNNLCGGVIPFTHFIEDMFIANGNGSYTYNATNLTNQGISLAAGMTAPPSIGNTVARGYFAGLRLDNAASNTFANVTIENNDLGVAYINGSTGNVIDEGIFITNNSHDVLSSTIGTNDLLDTSFNRVQSEIEDGIVRVLYNSIVQVVDPLLAPVENVNVDFISANGLISVSGLTNGMGLSPEVAGVAYLLTTSSIAETNGGYNPYSITVHATSTYAASSSQALLDGVSIFQMQLTLPPTPPITLPTSGGGGLPSIDPRTGTYYSVNTGATTPMVLNPNTHRLVKLADDGDVKTQHDSTVYYIGADGKRHAFPNPSVYGSWYCDFSQVTTISLSELSKYQLGKNITYRPGLRLVKFPTNPHVYVVQAGRTLRPIKDEATAASLFGANWSKLVSDIQDTFYNDYIFGEEVTTMTDKAFLDLSPMYPSAEMGIAGYQDLAAPGASATCTASPLSTTQQLSAPTMAWPFERIPNTYLFTTDLTTSSAASMDIRYLQEFLAYKGPSIYADGRITGIYGPLTEQAIKNYQRSKGISQTGTFGPLTRSAINAELNELR